MNKDQVKGAAKEIGGVIESAAGSVTGDTRTSVDGRVLEASGKIDGVVGQAKDAYEQARSTVQDTASRAADAIGPATETLKGVAGQIGDFASTARDTGSRLVEEGRRRIPEAGRHYRDGTEAVRSQVSESPLLALLVAGAVGYGLALLVHGRK